MSAPRTARFCIRCGAARLQEARFCASCGDDLSLQDAAPPVAAAPPAGPADEPALRYCPSCGAEQPQAHIFCTRCGSSLEPPPEPDPIPTPWVRADAAYPVRLNVRRVPQQGRLGALLRLPPAIVALVAAAAFLAVAVLAALAAWPCRLATGRYPRLLHSAAAAGLRFSTRAGCYAGMLSPAFPWSRPGQPVEIALPQPAGRPWLRLPALVPLAPLLVLEAVVAILCTVPGWFAIVFWGRLPEGMADVMEQPQRYALRFWAYALLLSDTYPWFQPEADGPACTAALT